MKKKRKHLTPEEFGKLLKIMAEEARRSPKWMQDYMKQIVIQTPRVSEDDCFALYLHRKKLEAENGKVLRTIFLREDLDDKLRLLANLSGKKKNEIIEEILDWVFSGMVGRPPKSLNYLKSL